MSSIRLIPLLALALSASASAQSFNVDVGTNITYPLPTATYAAAGLAGTWNAASAVLATPQALVDLGGAATVATLTRSGAGALNFDFNNASTFLNDQNLMDDCQDIGGTGGSTVWTFSNLAAGNYSLITYAWAPDSATFVTTVNGTTPVGGAWPAGGFTAGITHSVDSFPGVLAGGSIVVNLVTTTGFGSCNGFQLKLIAPTTPATGFCFGDGSGTACPCGNLGAIGNGCASSINPAGANLAGSGAASAVADTFLLSGTGMPNSSALYFQGTTLLAGTPFGDGLRCAGGSVIRLATKSNVGGASQYPDVGDLLISVKGLIQGNVTRSYQVWYRNAANFCQPETFNLSNGVAVTWIP